MNRKFIINLILLIQGFLIIFFLMLLDFNKIYLIDIKISVVFYFIISFILMRNINIFKDTICGEDKKDSFNNFNISEFDEIHNKRFGS